MNLWSWYVAVLNRYVQFGGRARRQEYWSFTLVSFLVSMGLMVIDMTVLGMTPSTGSHFGLSSLYGLAVLLPSLGVSVRRLHDTGRSGWWLLLSLIPLIGLLVILLFMVLDSDSSLNAYGPNPKA